MANHATPAPDAHPPRDPRFKGTWQDAALIESDKAKERRRRVLAHPDLAKRLCEPPYNLAAPEMWTGFVPPAEVPVATYWRPNNSPIRRQLIDILNAVAERDQGGDA